MQKEIGIDSKHDIDQSISSSVAANQNIYFFLKRALDLIVSGVALFGLLFVLPYLFY